MNEKVMGTVISIVLWLVVCFQAFLTGKMYGKDEAKKGEEYFRSLFWMRGFNEGVNLMRKQLEVKKDEHGD